MRITSLFKTKELSDPKQWYAVRTKFKCEKQVCRDLCLRAYEAFVPIQTFIKVYGRNKRKVQIPLISTYVFVKIGPKSFSNILLTPNIRHFIVFSNTPAIIPEKEINILKRITGQEDFKYALEEMNLAKGNKVEIVKGSLLGLRGELLELKGNKTVIVELTSLGISLQLHVPVDCLKKI